MAKEWD